MTGIPVYSVYNHCSAGSTGQYMANQFIQASAADCALVVGFDKMRPGALTRIYKESPVQDPDTVHGVYT